MIFSMFLVWLYRRICVWHTCGHKFANKSKARQPGSET